ncbi:MAG TPA: sugar O-acetyltransferase [Candidatus Oscillibacter excrementigallinarum]|uniref:Acetyltransferase n=1 Tax=Candidatus Oscillibacter excrementigallinarum TaxID=2838716 RepID=A0A9D2RS12_9FIRM|nr:sugar O-acetyltransferase [Candidatus Oscillibacter excrementigallinarum]
MTEKEKMLRGMLFTPSHDKELLADLATCKALCRQFNALAYQAEDIESAQALLRRLLGAAGEGLRIEPPFWCDYGWNITVGRNFYMNHGGVILDAGGVTFGDDVFIGPQCGFHTSGHPLAAEERNRGLEYARPIRVGSNVWIGAGVQVMPGVTIGDGAVIAGGSVVTRDIPAGVLAAGVPCRPIRPITEGDRMLP